MQKSAVLVTKNSLGKKKAKEKIYKIFDLETMHFFDMTHISEQELKPMPSNGAEVIELIKKYDIKNFGASSESVVDKIEAVRKSNYGQRYLLIDALEADPGIIHENWMLHNEKEVIELGIKAVKKTCNLNRVAIVSRFNDVQIDNVEIKKIDFGYSRPSDADLIRQAFDADLEDGSLEENGVLALNIQTVINIGLAACGVTPDVRYFTLANIATNEARVVRAPLGIFGAEVLNRVYGKQPDLKAYAGPGALCASPLELKPEIDYTTNIIAYANPIQFDSLDKCTDCGECQNVCPLKLPVPFVIKVCNALDQNKQLKRRDQKKLKNIDINEVANACTMCRACTYICKAGIDPTDAFAGARSGLALEKISKA